MAENYLTKSVEELLQDPTYNGYYRYQRVKSNLIEALEATRNQQGISIREISNCVKDVLDATEIDALVKELKNYGKN